MLNHGPPFSPLVQTVGLIFYVGVTVSQGLIPFPHSWTESLALGSSSPRRAELDSTERLRPPAAFQACPLLCPSTHLKHLVTQEVPAERT